MHKLVARVALLENEGIVKELIELIYHVKLLVISYPAREFTELPHFIN